MGEGGRERGERREAGEGEGSSYQISGAEVEPLGVRLVTISIDIGGAVRRHA